MQVLDKRGRDVLGFFLKRTKQDERTKCMPSL